MDELGADIAAVVAGDVGRLSALVAADHADLRDATKNLTKLSVSRSALIKVLEQWRSGRCVSGDVQRWASFVRRGYISGTVVGELRPIEIEYDASDEGLIVEIVGRLDEIGDQINGHIDDSEQERILRSLRG